MFRFQPNRNTCNLGRTIDGHVCQNSNCQLQLRILFANQGKQTFFSISVFHLRQTNRNSHFLLVPFSVYTVHIYICVYGNRKTEAQVIFLNPCTVCSSCTRKFVICPFVDEETNGSYPFANGLNGLYGLHGLTHP
jgi:hypothetical protein